MQYKLDEVMAHDALLLGRVTYEGFAQAWPGRSDEIGFADKMNSMEKYVVSSTLGRAEWTTRRLSPGSFRWRPRESRKDAVATSLLRAVASSSRPCLRTVLSMSFA